MAKKNMAKKTQSEIKDLAKQIKKLYKNFKPDKIKIDVNNITIFFDDDTLEISFIDENKISMRFRSIVDLALEETEEPEPEVFEPELEL
jgi:hypothetical protein